MGLKRHTYQIRATPLSTGFLAHRHGTLRAMFNYRLAITFLFVFLET